MENISGEVYRGKLLEAEDNMNCQMSQITMTARDGKVSQLEQIFVRGSKIRFVILPDMLKNAPMFKKMLASQKGSMGRGKSSMLQGQIARGRGGRGRGFGGGDRGRGFFPRGR